MRTRNGLRVILIVMTPTATSVGACCSLLRAGLKRPAEMSRSIDFSGLVDAEDGLVDRAVFTDAQRYRQEWGRCGSRSGTWPGTGTRCSTTLIKERS